MKQILKALLYLGLQCQYAGAVDDFLKKRVIFRGLGKERIDSGWVRLQVRPSLEDAGL